MDADKRTLMIRPTSLSKKAEGKAHMFGVDKQPRRVAPLDKVLLIWNDLGDVFRKRELLQSLCAQGASNSGETPGVGFQLGNALDRDGSISGLIIPSKPGEDLTFWQKLFPDNNKADALIVVAQETE
jgi:hypothetical protein